MQSVTPKVPSDLRRVERSGAHDGETGNSRLGGEPLNDNSVEDTWADTCRLDASAIAAIAHLDPLCADAACRTVPRLNAAADVAGLADALRRIVPSLSTVGRYSPFECAAAMRDLGIFLGSLKRHGVEPVTAVPEIEVALVELGRRTVMIPRDTVYHYGPWNPVGERQRMYTGAAEETVLIDSVRRAAPALDDGLRALEAASELAVNDPMLASLLTRATDGVKTLIDALDGVRRALPPVFFARSLRPYFEEVTIAGCAYLGPAAAHLPLYLIDELVWSSDRPDDQYASFKRDTARHGLPSHRNLFARRQHRPSLTSVVTHELRAVGLVPPDQLRDVGEDLVRLLRLLVTFRGRHLVLARREYAEAVRLYPLGSGGASVELLHEILELTRQSAVLASPGATHPTYASPDQHGDCEGHSLFRTEGEA